MREGAAVYGGGGQARRSFHAACFEGGGRRRDGARSSRSAGRRESPAPGGETTKSGNRWPRRPPVHRNSAVDVFPLPVPTPLESSSTGSRCSRRRATRRLEVVRDTEEVVWGRCRGTPRPLPAPPGWCRSAPSPRSSARSPTGILAQCHNPVRLLDSCWGGALTSWARGRRSRPPIPIASRCRPSTVSRLRCTPPLARTVLRF